MDPTNFNLTADQVAAKEAFHSFLCDPFETVFVLEGYSGCGKSTLVKTLNTELPDFMRMAKLINPDMVNYQVAFTATTNKAADNLRQILGEDVKTIQSFLHLRVETTDYKKRTTELKPRDGFVAEGFLLFIDEASFIDAELLKWIFARTKNCKIVMVGDPAQLLTVGCIKPPVFNGKYSGAKLLEVVRQAKGNPITELATMFRHTVNTGEWPQFKPDGNHIQYLAPADFEAAILKEFDREGWSFADSKILAWTNKRAVQFNEFVKEHVSGNPHFKAGDYAVNNKYVSQGKNSIPTDRLVHIDHISEGCMVLGALGNHFTVDGMKFFMPKTQEERSKARALAKAEDRMHDLATIDEGWIDLRAIFAQTINKSQGSTYGKVFIDLNDVAKCHSGDQMARMLYVGVSRARDQVLLTGDLT